jgi:hypothetical protein
VVMNPSFTDCLAILTPALTSAPLPPTLFLVPVSPQSLKTAKDQDGTVAAQSETASQSSMSSSSQRKRPQSNSSDGPSSFRLEQLRLLKRSSQRSAHIVPVALCRKGDQWSPETLQSLAEFGIRDILSVPCESANIGGLYMVTLPVVARIY